jgi:hypothetical protein
MRGVVKKITLSFEVIAAIIAVTLLQACTETPPSPPPRPSPTPRPRCVKPTLTGPLWVPCFENCPAPCHQPPDWGFYVTIKTTTPWAKLRYTTDGTNPTPGPNGHGTQVPLIGTWPVTFGKTHLLYFDRCGKIMLKAIAYKPPPTNWDPSPIKQGCYVYTPP